MELSLSELKILLAEVITPKLLGFTYNGTYFWYSPWENHCRKVIQLSLLKGSAVFLWGICLDFLPVFTANGSLRYQRTDQSVGLHLFCRPPGYWQCNPKTDNLCRFSRFGNSPIHVESELLRAFHEAQNFFVPWFQNCSGLPDALAEAQRQQTDPDSHHNWPDPDYVTAFLLAANGKAEEGIKILEQFWMQRGQNLPPALYDKLKKKLLNPIPGQAN